MGRRTPAPRVDDAFTTTLGTLVGRLFGSSDVTEGTDTAADAAASEPEDVANFAMRVQLSLSADHHARTQSELKELVLLRNNLVHHFIDQHDLWSTDGCLTARDTLVAAYERIDKYFEQLRGWAKHMDQVRRLSADFLQSDARYDFMINGIFPDDTVNWPAAGIVRALRVAAGERAVDGWTSVAAAGRWIVEQNPEQRPNTYGCTSWRQVLLESRLFELRYPDVDGQRTACRRVRTE